MDDPGACNGLASRRYDGAMRGFWVGVVLTGLLGCNGAEVTRDEVRPEVQEEAPGEVQVEPLPEAPEAAHPEEGPTEELPPTTEPLPSEETNDDAVEASATTAAVRVVSSTCGENVREAQGELAATVRRRGRSLRIAIRDLSYYCQPPPRFEARIDGTTVEVHILPPEPGRPVARCVCLHDATIVVDEVPASVSTVRFVEDGGTQGLSVDVPPA